MKAAPPNGQENRLESYDFLLPDELIAQIPVMPRSASRLLVVDRKAGSWRHERFDRLPQLLDSGDLLVANNTRVLKARLLGQRLREESGRMIEGGRVEFVMLEQKGPLEWEGLFHASAKYVPGLKFRIPTPDGKGLLGELTRGSADSATGTVIARFDRDPEASGAGEIPLPKYIERKPEHSDETSYQTVYAKQSGSAAAPTAGLHFTQDILQALAHRGVGWEELTLHVGLGTFRPVKDPEISKHAMHEERFFVRDDVASRITAQKREGRRIVAVGTTSVRTLESAWDGSSGCLRAGEGRTSLFIRPGAYEFQVVDRMITNFHLPRSTLLMLVCAFAGRDLVLAAYEDAVREKYRFFSYGDAMLIV